MKMTIKGVVVEGSEDEILRIFRSLNDGDSVTATGTESDLVVTEERPEDGGSMYQKAATHTPAHFWKSCQTRDKMCLYGKTTASMCSYCRDGYCTASTLMSNPPQYKRCSFADVDIPLYRLCFELD